MRANLIDHTAAYFLDRCGLSFDALIAPIDEAMPCGRPIRGQELYHAISRARQQDDGALPQGVWEREPRRADWDKVSYLALEILARHSKDLQVAVWLLEARIHKDGFDGVGPCILLLQMLCERYWDHLHPQAEDGDMEPRANVIAWAALKFVPELRSTPLTGVETQGEFSWADWEQARRNEQVCEQMRAQGGRFGDGVPEGPSCDDVQAAMRATSLEAHAHRHAMLGAAIEAIDALSRTLGQCLGPGAPSLLELSGLLERIRTFIGEELRRRSHDSGPSVPAAAVEPVATQAPGPVLAVDPLAVDALSEDVMRDRAQAYAILGQVADYLMRIEPHSPVPYLVRRATEWGALNTAQLYEELFLKLNGQLSIFEMLGIEAAAEDRQG